MAALIMYTNPELDISVIRKGKLIIRVQTVIPMDVVFLPLATVKNFWNTTLIRGDKHLPPTRHRRRGKELPS